MTSPRYYKGLPEWLLIVIVVTIGLAGIVLGLLQAEKWVRQDERKKIGAAVDSLRPIVWPVQYARLTRERDSLREVLVVRDSIAGASDAAARASIARLRTLLAATPITHYDTVLIAAATETANMCTTAANDCDSVRAANARLQFVKDSVADADSTANARLLLSVAAQTRTIGDLTTRLERRPSWGTVHVRTGAGFSLGFAAGYGACAIRK